jgi:membrane-bound ClpP family serine protease
MSMILGFIAAALVLVFFEIILPGGVLGVLAALCVCVATWFGFELYGAMGALVVFFGALFAIGLFAFVEFKLLAKTSLGQQFFLKAAIDGHTREAVAEDSIVGREGITLTRLNPSGKVAIGQKSYEACSQDGYIDRDQAIAVVAQDNFKLIIKKL